MTAESDLLERLTLMSFAGMSKEAAALAQRYGIPQDVLNENVMRVNAESQARRGSNVFGEIGNVTRVGRGEVTGPGDFFRDAATLGAIGYGTSVAGGGGAGGGGIAPGGVSIPGMGIPGTNVAALGMRGAGLLGSNVMASGKGGGGGSGDAGAIQSQLAMELINQTDPLRRALIERSGAFLGGGIDNSAQFSAFKAAAEPQFAQARESVIANTPTGGGLTSALTQLEGQRARTLTEAQGGIEQQELARAMQLGTGMTGPALSTLGNAANVQAMIAQSEADREAGMLGALGAGAGAYFGSKA